MQKIIKPDSRLLSALPYLTPGGRAADIGTDHAYLPIYLVGQGILSHALACDINEGPIQSARANIRAAGLEGRVDTLRTDGLRGVENYAPDDVMIFGMGGELIARILSEAEWVKTAKTGLILQPMSRLPVLRRWLWEAGFAILGESLTFEDKYYVTLHARWQGEPVSYTEEECLLGKRDTWCPGELTRGYLEHEIGVRQRIVEAKERSREADAAREMEELHFLENRLEELA